MLEGFRYGPIDPDQAERRERQRTYAKVYSALERNATLSGILDYGVDKVIGLEKDLSRNGSSLSALSGRQGTTGEFAVLLGLVKDYFDARNGHREETLARLAGEIHSLKA